MHKTARIDTMGSYNKVSCVHCTYAHTLTQHTHISTNALGPRQCWFWRHFTQASVWPREMSNTASHWLLLWNRCALLVRKTSLLMPQKTPLPLCSGQQIWTKTFWTHKKGSRRTTDELFYLYTSYVHLWGSLDGEWQNISGHELLYENKEEKKREETRSCEWHTSKI